MATITYEDVVPSLIENATMKKMLSDGVHRTYNITPNEGYVLHDATYDDYFDIDGNELAEPRLGYRRTTASCAASYNFTANPREFYTVPESEVPADQIFGVPTDTEIM